MCKISGVPLEAIISVEEVRTQSLQKPSLQQHLSFCCSLVCFGKPSVFRLYQIHHVQDNRQQECIFMETRALGCYRFQPLQFVGTSLYKNNHHLATSLTTW